MATARKQDVFRGFYQENITIPLALGHKDCRDTTDGSHSKAHDSCLVLKLRQFDVFLTNWLSS
jgi:hypothetical protein